MGDISHIMELEYKPDFYQVKERMEAWWQDEVLDRIPVKVTAPIEEIEGCEGWIISAALPLSVSGGSLFEEKDWKHHGKGFTAPVSLFYQSLYTRNDYSRIGYVGPSSQNSAKEDTGDHLSLSGTSHTMYGQLNQRK